MKTVAKDKTTGEVRIYPLDRFKMIVNVNLVGTFCICQSAAGMLELEPVDHDGERGVIINTGSVAAQDGQIGQVAYSASKAGIVGMTLTIARDLSRDGVRVNTILPGIFNTPPMNAARDSVKAALNASVPFPRRMGEPPEFASLVMEMIQNSYFNGETVRLDGAIRMPPR